MAFSIAQARAEADALDVEVLVDGFELFAQRDEMLLAAQQPPQQARELHDQHPRRFRLRSDQRGDRRQRVEEEVRVDLAGERLDARRHQQLFLLLQAVLDARAVPDLDRAPRRTAPSRESTSASSHEFGARGSRGAVGSSNRWPSAWRMISRPIGAASRITTQSIWNRRTSRQTLRCRSVKNSGEKCQMASFGQISRRPPPAKPQPTAKGRAIHSPAITGGMPTIDADDGPRVRPGEQAGEEGAGERQVRGVVVEEQARQHAERQRQAEAAGKDQALRPVPLFRQQDSPEPVEAHEHRRQHGHDGDFGHQASAGTARPSGTWTGGAFIKSSPGRSILPNNSAKYSILRDLTAVSGASGVYFPPRLAMITG